MGGCDINWVCPQLFGGFPGGSDGEESACNGGDLGSIPGSEDPLEQEMATVATFLELLLCISLLSPDEKEQIEGR